MTTKFSSVEEYLASFPDDVREVLEGVRRAILAAAPDAEETIAYDMPTYRVGGRSLVHFAGWTSYVSVYPLPGAAPASDPGLEADLAAYRATRGTGRFPLDEPVPHELVSRVVRALRAERFGTGPARP